MIKHRIQLRNLRENLTIITSTLLIFLAVLASMSLAGDQDGAYKLPREIRSLKGSDLTNPPQTILDIENTVSGISDTTTAVIWLKFKGVSVAELQEIKVVFSSHPNLGFEEKAIAILKNTSFGSFPTLSKKRPKWLYHEVIFNGRLFRAKLHEDSALIDFFKKSGFYDSTTGELKRPDIWAEMIYQARPEYPTAAKATGQTGTVWIRVLVDEKGVVKRASVAKSSGHALLDKSALDVAPKNKFKSALLKGQPIPSWCTYKIDFALGHW